MRGVSAGPLDAADGPGLERIQIPPLALLWTWKACPSAGVHETKRFGAHRRGSSLTDMAAMTGARSVPHLVNFSLAPIRNEPRWEEICDSVAHRRFRPVLMRWMSSHIGAQSAAAQFRSVLFAGSGARHSNRRAFNRH